MTWMLHRTMVGLIRRMPLPIALICFRAYNKLLRLLGPEHRARTYFGARVYCDARDLIQRMILHFGVWEPNVSRAIERSLSRGDARRYRRQHRLRHVARVPPCGRLRQSRIDRSLTDYLRAPVAQPGAQRDANIRAVNLAVSDKPTKLDLYESSDKNIGATTTLASWRGGTPSVSVEALPLSTTTSEERTRLRLIKLDIEGAEPAVMREVLDTLAMYPRRLAIIVEANPHEIPHGSEGHLRSAAGRRLRRL